MKTVKKVIGLLGIIGAFFLSSYSAKAQFVSAEIGVDGLTCSACTRSVEMSLRKLDFVQDVQMNLDNTMGTITFKTGSKVDMEKVAKAVINAGFSVRYLTATFKPENAITVSDNYCFAYGGDTYQFVKVSSTQLQNTATFKFLGKEFLSAKDYKKWKADLKSQCTGAKSLYYVTL